MAGFWGRRAREEEERLTAADEALSKRARVALVAADERIRTTGDELDFATAELGESATAELRAGLDAVRTHMSEAFQLHQLNHDEIPDTPEELRTRNARIVQLCEWAEAVLDERTSALQARIARVREAPSVLRGVRAEAARLRERLPEMRDTLARLADRYRSDTLQRVRMSAEEAERLLDFADHSAEVSERRRSAGRPEEANLALEAATESVRRANAVFDGVDSFEIEALRAQTTLSDVIDDSRGDIAEAIAGPRTPAIDEALRALQEALATVTSGGDRDPFTDLALLSGANAALDAARAEAARPVIPLERVQHEISASDHSIGVATALIEGQRGWIGADARTRLAEARRIRQGIDGLETDVDAREQVIQLARRATTLADEALRLAQRDIDSSRPDGDDWGWGGGGRGYGGRGGQRGGNGSGMLGPILGGMVLGGLLDDIFD
ncbi:hypothetical protein JD292_09440 [Leucobacter sp. CSA2]|uniref:Uncharacterized protein n=1 Tax=Leucobacter edaphi TaxID=2796472 RepID=A0A934QCV5_9MICO|nr:hypothetical protein [Leucobacter edaphi]MBK0422295.1 hypothetical protein [Leucobacter edaphi]